MTAITPAMEEITGDGFFVPVHPKPRVGPAKTVQTLLRARRDMLGNWAAADYRVGVRPFRLLGRQMVFVNSPDGIRQALVAGHDNYERKTPQMRRALEHLLGDGLFISDGETWKNRRALVADIVHKNRLPEFAGAMEAEAADAVALWAEADPEKPVDVLADMGALTARIIARTVFGVRLDRALAREAVAGFAEYQDRVQPFNLGYLLGFDDGLPVWRSLRLRQAVRKVQRVVDRVIEDQLEGRGEHARMLELLSLRQQKSPTAAIGRDALRDEASTLFMAGHETTASVLAWSWYCLAHAPWAEAAVHAEIAEVLGGRAPTLADVARLDYCRAVVEETMRLYPPVAILGRQARAAARIDKVEVEPAALILVSPWLLHRSPDLWEEPDRFRPERFLGSARPPAYHYIPFAAGPRICPGMNFGLSEAVLCLATLAQRFTLRLPGGARVEPQCRLTLRPKGGLPMHVRPRR